jgi:hypothetical protein
MLMKPMKTFDPTRPIYPNPSTLLPSPRPSGSRRISRPRLVACPASPPRPPPSDVATRFFFPQAAVNVALTTPAPHRPSLAQTPRGCAPLLASHLPGRIPARLRAHRSPVASPTGSWRQSQPRYCTTLFNNQYNHSLSNFTCSKSFR